MIMKLLIKFPTRNRKNKFFKVLKQYQNLCEDFDNTFFLITLDNDDETMKPSEVSDIFGTFKNIKVVYGNSNSKIHAINRDIELVDEWDIVLLASDDMTPKVKGYDNIIRNRMKEYYPDTDGILWFNDGHQGNKLNTLSILGKKYYDRFGYIYQPEYKSVWSDNEFMMVGNLLGKQTYLDEVIIEHEHPDWGYGNRDIIHQINSQNESHDRNLFVSRKNNNFYL
jgi:hypothetical protein